MKRRLIACALSVGLAITTGASQAWAAPPETTTTTTRNLVETFEDVVPTCGTTGALYTITTTTNVVEHETVFDDGRVHAKFMQTGTFVATHPTLPDYTGKFTTTGTFNINGSTETSSFVFNIRGTSDEGSTFKLNETGHFNMRPDGSVNEFFRCHDR